MKRNTTKKLLNTTTALAALLLLSACGVSERLSEIGHPPTMSRIANPTAQPGYRPLSMPMPQQDADASVAGANSLWQAQRQTFFKDQRASKIGDIVTVSVSIEDKANLQNSTDRSKTGTESVGAPSVLGFETKFGKILPDAVNPASLLDLDSASASKGSGKIQRSEAIDLKLAATVVQLLPNGNFVIQGRQQVVVNNEMRDLYLQGIIRPEDILNDNTVSYEKIAEARISYGGKGNLTDLQAPRYGQQFMDAIMPF